MTYEPLKAITPPENHWPKQLDEIPHVKSGMTVPLGFSMLPDLLDSFVPCRQVSSEGIRSRRGLRSLVHQQERTD
jgi:hypothetical protein